MSRPQALPILGAEIWEPVEVARDMDGVKHAVAFASGKGGVGKSTCTVNVALALRYLGLTVGVLDADIYGPSVAHMLGVPPGQRPEAAPDDQMYPVEALGIRSMSMAYLTTERTPLVWRGPLAGGALAQLLAKTAWGELDCLLIDMPPGTGDIQLTLTQKIALSGVVIVTTPQEVALLDARKGIEMFQKVEVPLLGIIENMAFFRCSECGQKEPIFGVDGGERVAAEYGSKVLAQVPLAPVICEDADRGAPSVARDPESPVAAPYLNAARNLMAALEEKRVSSVGPAIHVSDD
ncbi:MAG: Mrp/NBP35 family ATP-binding protein [Pseudomonadota bacterium]